MKKKTSKQQAVTQDYLHKALTEQSKVIVGAFGSKITEIKKQTDTIKTDINTIKSQLKETNTRIDGLSTRVDKIYDLIDRYLKAQEVLFKNFPY